MTLKTRIRKNAPYGMIYILVESAPSFDGDSVTAQWEGDCLRLNFPTVTGKASLVLDQAVARQLAEEVIAAHNVVGVVRREEV